MVEHGQEMKMFWKWRETQWLECLALDPMVVKRGGDMEKRWRPESTSGCVDMQQFTKVFS